MVQVDVPRVARGKCVHGGGVGAANLVKSTVDAHRKPVHYPDIWFRELDSAVDGIRE